MSNASDTTDQEAIERQQKLLATHRERLAILLEQHAHFGAYAPPHVISEIRATQEALRPIKAWLCSQGVMVADEPNDDMPIALSAAMPPAPDGSTQTINNLAPNQGAQGIFNAPIVFNTYLTTPPLPLTFETATRRDYYAHVPLPPNYIERATLLAEVRATLLESSTNIALTSTLVVHQPATLHGMGGIGKSVCARALCDDPAVQAAFPDGILWATLGQTPDRTGILRVWVETLGGIVSETAPTVESLKANLAYLLQDRACLLIADDIWKRTDAEILQVGGPRCCMLITTRDEAITEGLGAKVQSIPVMTEAEAIILLDEWADHRLAATEPAMKAQIVRRLGYLPLAVKLAGPQLRRKAPDEWLRTFGIHRLTARRPETVHDSLVATFGLSLDDLRLEERRLYVALAIFKEDEPIYAAGIARLWQELGRLAPDETADLLDDLASRALLELQVANRPGPWRSVVLHDLLRDLMSTELTDSGHLTAHGALLTAYGVTCASTGWHTAPDDGYLYDHLAYHLAATGAADQLDGLFANHAWMHVRFEQREYTYDGYLEDLDRAWTLMSARGNVQIDAGAEPTALANLVRYTLLRASINSLATNYPPALVVRAVELGLWPPKRALALARKVANDALRAEMSRALLATQKLHGDLRVAAQTLGVELL